MAAPSTAPRFYSRRRGTQPAVRIDWDADFGEVILWNIATVEEVCVLRMHPGGFTNVAFGPDGQRIASAGNDGTVILWDSQTGNELFRLNGHTGMVASVAFSSVGRRLATAG